jgi:hypothetical protein
MRVEWDGYWEVLGGETLTNRVDSMACENVLVKTFEWCTRAEEALGVRCPGLMLAKSSNRIVLVLV